LAQQIAHDNGTKLPRWPKREGKIKRLKSLREEYKNSQQNSGSCPLVRALGTAIDLDQVVDDVTTDKPKRERIKK